MCWVCNSLQLWHLNFLWWELCGYACAQQFEAVAQRFYDQICGSADVGVWALLVQESLWRTFLLPMLQALALLPLESTTSLPSKLVRNILASTDSVQPPVQYCRAQECVCGCGFILCRSSPSVMWTTRRSCSIRQYIFLLFMKVTGTGIVAYLPFLFTDFNYI